MKFLLLQWLQFPAICISTSIFIPVCLYVSTWGKANIWTQSGSRNCALNHEALHEDKPCEWDQRGEWWTLATAKVLSSRSVHIVAAGTGSQLWVEDLWVGIPGKRRQRSFSQEMESGDVNKACFAWSLDFRESFRSCLMPCVAYLTTGDNGKMWSRMSHQFAEFPKSSYWIVGISKSAIL